MVINLDFLTHALRSLIIRAKELSIERVVLNDDYYWNIGSSERESLDVHPDDIVIGSLADDLASLEKLLHKTHPASLVDFDRLGNVMIAVGENFDKSQTSKNGLIVSLEMLEKLLSLLIAQAHASGIQHVDLSSEAYWDISAAMRYNVYQAPEFTQRSLMVDAELLKQIIENKRSVSIVDFVPLGNLVIAAGDGLSRSGDCFIECMTILF